MHRAVPSVVRAVVLALTLMTTIITPKQASANGLAALTIKKAGEVAVGVVGGLIANCLWDTTACKAKVKRVFQPAVDHWRDGKQKMIKEAESNSLKCKDYGWMASCAKSW